MLSHGGARQGKTRLFKHVKTPGIKSVSYLVKNCIRTTSENTIKKGSVCLLNHQTAPETTSLHTSPVSELGGIHPTVFITFKNGQADNYTNFTQWLARCVRVWKKGRIWTSLSSFLLPFFTWLISLTVCTTVHHECLGEQTVQKCALILIHTINCTETTKPWKRAHFWRERDQGGDAAEEAITTGFCPTSADFWNSINASDVVLKRQSNYELVFLKHTKIITKSDWYDNVNQAVWLGQGEAVKWSGQRIFLATPLASSCWLIEVFVQ